MPQRAAGGVTTRLVAAARAEGLRIDGGRWRGTGGRLRLLSPCPAPKRHRRVDADADAAAGRGPGVVPLPLPGVSFGGFSDLLTNASLFITTTVWQSGEGELSHKVEGP